MEAELYQWRDMDVGGGGAIALPRSIAPRSFVRCAAPARFTLTVDLAENPFSARWWRGVATLLLLCGSVATIAPKFEPVAAAPVGADERQAREYREIGISALAAGSRSGARMVASDRVSPLLAAPERAAIDLDLKLSADDRIDRLLVRVGAVPADAETVAKLVASAAPRGLDVGTSIKLRLGRRAAGGFRGIERVALRAGLDVVLTINGGADGLSATVRRIAVDQRPRRIRGRVGDGLYWSLRSSGVSTETATDYLKALATRLDVGADLGPDDRFDLVIAHRRAATGEERSGPLLYAGVERFGGSPVQMLNWTVGGRTGWYDAASLAQISSSALAWPVSAPVTSNFGLRVHPILRFARMHKGMDFGAHWGTPIVASADGLVSRAGWAGGYGRQVRIAHAGGIATSYSHMSRMVVAPGTVVRQGQLIGYVGSSGLSTGPHLHYETYRGGRAVNPRSVRFAGAPVFDRLQAARFKARLKQLLNVGAAH
ncbi:MAG TPA: M23 family metallopeptidase [Sphingomicrobium sp.]|nr:M23 family metallopeptidase [Sphingomicrobium sp.]